MEDLEGKLKEASDARMRLIATDGDPPDRPSSHAKRHNRLLLHLLCNWKLALCQQANFCIPRFC